MDKNECLNEKCRIQAEYILLLEDYVDDLVKVHHELMLKNAELIKKTISQTLSAVDSQGNIDRV